MKPVPPIRGNPFVISGGEAYQDLPASILEEPVTSSKWIRTAWVAESEEEKASIQIIGKIMVEVHNRYQPMPDIRCSVEGYEGLLPLSSPSSSLNASMRYTLYFKHEPQECLQSGAPLLVDFEYEARPFFPMSVQVPLLDRPAEA